MKHNFPRGIKVIYGIYRDDSSIVVQSFLFDMDIWSIWEAQNWLNKHGFKYKSVDVPETGKYVHFRQKDPKKFIKLRTSK